MNPRLALLLLLTLCTSPTTFAGDSASICNARFGMTTCDTCVDDGEATVSMTFIGDLENGNRPSASETFCLPCTGTSTIVWTTNTVADEVKEILAPVCTTPDPLLIRVTPGEVAALSIGDVSGSGDSYIPSHATMQIEHDIDLYRDLYVTGTVVALDQELSFFNGAGLIIQDGGEFVVQGFFTIDFNTVLNSISVESGGLLTVDAPLELDAQTGAIESAADCGVDVLSGGVAVVSDLLEVTGAAQCRLEVHDGGLLRMVGDAQFDSHESVSVRPTVKAGGRVELISIGTVSFTNAYFVYLESGAEAYVELDSSNELDIVFSPGSTITLGPGSDFDQRRKVAPDLTGVRVVFQGADFSTAFFGNDDITMDDSTVLSGVGTFFSYNNLTVPAVTVNLEEGDHIQVRGSALDIGLLHLTMAWTEVVPVLDLKAPFGGVVSLGSVSLDVPSSLIGAEEVLVSNTLDAAIALGIAGSSLTIAVEGVDVADSSCATLEVRTRSIVLNMKECSSEIVGDGNDDDDPQGLSSGVVVGLVGLAVVGAVSGAFMFVQKRQKDQEGPSERPEGAKRLRDGRDKKNARARSPTKARGPRARSPSKGRAGVGGGKKRRNPAKTVEGAIKRLMKEFSIPELCGYVKQLSAAGKHDAALALVLKLEEEAADGPVILYMNVLNLVGETVDAAGEADAGKAVKEAKRRTGALGRDAVMKKDKSLKTAAGAKSVYRRATLVWDEDAPSDEGDGDLWGSKSVKGAVQKTPIRDMMANDFESDMVTLTSSMAPNI